MTNMLYHDFSEKILGLQEVMIKKVEEIDGKLFIYIEKERKMHTCPCCGEQTDHVHDYRLQPIKDAPCFGRPVMLMLNKRRYRCVHCGKRFYEEISFLPRYYRMSRRLIAYVLDKLRDERSFTSVAKDFNLSVSTVIRVFDYLSYPKATLSSALSIDEFKGNTGREKYQCILTDPVKHVVLDILPKRYDYYLTNYFKSYPGEEREKVRYFVSDMWRPYASAASAWFPNATQIIDKYHWIRQVGWAFEGVRKEAQREMSPQRRRYFKRSKRLLSKRESRLTDTQREEVHVMRYYSDTLSRAYQYKEDFLDIVDLDNAQEARKELGHWIYRVSNSEIPQFMRAGQTMQNWFGGIVNSYTTTITNGFTEGCNNKIKVLKRNAYGYRNFDRFRNRILHMFSHQKP